MKTNKLISLLFALSSVYDGLLGIAFLFWAEPIFRCYGVTPPNHFGYVRFPAELLVVFGIMFAVIAMDPRKNRDLIPYGILLKLSFCSTVFYYWARTGIPDMWKPFAVCDFIFMLLFIWAWLTLSIKESPE
jgi:hypothetical protein